jgi:hypothetical protein
LHKRQSDDTHWDSRWSKKIYCLRSWLDWGEFSPEEVSLAWKAFCRLEIFTRLGMAHTCCRYGYHFSDICTVSSDERSELQEEDTKAGLVDDLNSMMDKYEDLEANHPGPLSEFLASWWSYLNNILGYNETWEGRGEHHKGTSLNFEEYLDCDSEVFFMTLDQLRELCMDEDDDSGNEESDLEDIEDLEKWPEDSTDDFCSRGGEA